MPSRRSDLRGRGDGTGTVDSVGTDATDGTDGTDGTGTEAGYVTVEAAIVFTALTAVIGVIVAGVVTVASYLGAVDLARDAARAAALDPADASGAAVAVAAASDPDAQVTVGTAGGGDLITVQVTRPGRLFDLSATAVIVAEPVGASP